MQTEPTEEIGPAEMSDQSHTVMEHNLSREKEEKEKRGESKREKERQK